MMTEGDLKEAARLIVSELREQVNRGQKKDRELRKRGEIHVLAILGVANWIEKRFVEGSTSP